MRVVFFGRRGLRVGIVFDFMGFEGKARLVRSVFRVRFGMGSISLCLEEYLV